MTHCYTGLKPPLSDGTEQLPELQLPASSQYLRNLGVIVLPDIALLELQCPFTARQINSFRDFQLITCGMKVLSH